MQKLQRFASLTTTFQKNVRMMMNDMMSKMATLNVCYKVGEVPSNTTVVK